MGIKSKLSGSSLIYAIVVVIITATIALMMLYSYNFNNVFLQKAFKRKLAEYYAYQGFAILSARTNTGNYSKSYDVSCDWVLNINKTSWGVYDLYTSTILTHSDTLLSKKSLIGLGRMKDSIAIRIANNGVVVHIGDSVDIKGQCIIPFGIMQPYGYKGNYELPKRLIIAKDTLHPLLTDSLSVWINKFGTPPKGIVYLNDSVHHTFYQSTKVFASDTIVVNNTLTGNIFLLANVIIVTKNVSLNDIILSARYVYIDDNFNGNLQCFASSGIKIGKNCKFNFPSIISLLTETPAYSTIDIGDSLFLQGEIYASSKDNRYKKLVTLVANKAFVLGDLYSSGSLMYSGVCNGSITCEKILSKSDFTIEENYLQDIIIDRDKLPDYFDCSQLNLYGSRNKIVKWMY